MTMTERPEFTYGGYLELLALLQDEGFACASYTNWKDEERPVILRHDVDYDVRAALRLAEIEKEQGATSTYFILLRNGLYNPLSAENAAMIKAIAALGHDVGLHFDEKAYPQDIDMAAAIQQEANMLSQALDLPIESVSMHRPSEECLKGDWKIPGLVNSYGAEYCGYPFKYLSDSRRCWREPIYDVVRSGVNSHLHILTHAFWYQDSPTSLARTIKDYLNAAISDRKELLYQNFSDLGEVLGEGKLSE